MNLGTIMNQYYGDLSNWCNHLPLTTGPTENSTPYSRPPRLLIGLLFIVILLECVFVKEINENKNQTGLELDCEFKNISDKFDIYDYGNLFNRYLPTTYTTSHPTPGSCPASYKFTDSGVESREQLDLECFKGCFDNGNNFFSVNVDEIFYDNEYGVLLSIRPSDTPHAAAIILNGNNNEMSEINILECKFGVYLCKSGIINEIYNGMIIGM